MNLIIHYGWHALLIAVVGEMLIPVILASFYKGYKHHQEENLQGGLSVKPSFFMLLFSYLQYSCIAFQKALNRSLAHTFSH